MNINQFGKLSTGEVVQQFELENKQGMKAIVSNLGGVLTNLWVPDHNHHLIDVVLGYDSSTQYEKNTNTFFGATVGRNANRIAQAQFMIEGQTYQLAKNEGENNLHSGPEGFQLRVWETVKQDEAMNEITFRLVSPDGDQGFPGELEVLLTYRLTEANELILRFEGTSDQATVFNPTNHSYFNLNGHGSGHILNHRLQINGDAFTPIADSASIPTGAIQPVDKTPMDFRTMHRISEGLDQSFQQLAYTKGYDHNYVLNDSTYAKAAEVTGDLTDISLEVWTDLPGLQFYAGNFLANEKGKSNVYYQENAGLCLETQFYPNAVNEPTFASPLIPKNKKVTHQTMFKFK